MYPGGNIIRVTPTLSTDAYAGGDVLFAATEIPNAVSSRGGTSLIMAMQVVDYSDDQNDQEIFYVFSEKQTDLGTVNATAGVSDADFKASNPMGYVFQDSNQAFSGATIDNFVINNVFTADGTGGAAVGGQAFMLKADEGSTSVYVSGVLRATGGAPTYAADSLQLIFHIKYLD